MSNRSVVVLGGLISSAVFIAIFFTNNYALLAFLIGFITGLINIQWLFREADRAMDEELAAAIKRYKKSLFARLGMVTLVVAIVGKIKIEWLFLLTLGIAVGVIIPLILAIREQLMRGRG